MVTRGFAFKRRDHHLNIDTNMVLRVQYHGSRGLRFGNGTMTNRLKLTWKHIGAKKKWDIWYLDLGWL